MKCKEKRSLFDLFKVFTCNECTYNVKDEELTIGGNIVNIYYLDHNCLDDKLDDLYIANNKKLKIFLKDLIYCAYNKRDDIIIWINREENKLLENMKIIYNLLTFENDLHILVF